MGTSGGRSQQAGMAGTADQSPAKPHSPAKTSPSQILPTQLLTRVVIPKIGMDAIVVEGTSHKALSAGPGHVEETAMPGENGNAVITAHRDTFFRHIYELNKGDQIQVRRNGRVFTYEVTDKKIVPPQDMSVINPTTDPQLTLITCYPTTILAPRPSAWWCFPGWWKAMASPPSRRPRRTAADNSLSCPYYNGRVNSCDVIIAGAGIIGVSLALELRERGAKVLVLDRGEPGYEASSAAAGMLAPTDPDTPPALRPLALESARMFPEFVGKLETLSGMKADFRRHGTIAFLDSASVQPLRPSTTVSLPTIFGGWNQLWKAMLSQSQDALHFLSRKILLIRAC